MSADARDAQRGTAAARERPPDAFAASRRRAVPARTDRRLCAPRRDRACARPRRAHAPGGGRRRALPGRAAPSRRISTSSTESLASHHSGAIAAGRLQPRAARSTSSASTCATLDLRQKLGRASSRVVAELLRARRGLRRLSQAGRGRARAPAGCASSRMPRPLLSPHAALLARWRSASSRVFDAARELRARFGARAIAKLHHLAYRAAVSDLLEVALLQKEAGLLHRHRGAPQRPDRRPAVRDHRRPAALRRRSWTSCSSTRPAHLMVAAAAALQEVMLGYSDSNKDGGFLDVAAGSCTRRASSSCAVCRRARRAAAPVPRPRRHRRARRRPELRGDPGAAAGQRRGQLRLTEQGEVIAAKYADPRIGRRNLETLVSATLRGDLLTPLQQAQQRRTSKRRWTRSSRARVSPPIASSSTRPAASPSTSSRPRRSARSSSSTSAAGRRRARPAGASRTCARFPGCSAGAQCRLLLPGWFGFGSGSERYLAAAPSARRGARARPCCARWSPQWPFFRALTRRTWTWCSPRSTSRIAARYAQLVSRQGAGRAQIFARIRAELPATAQALARDHRADAIARVAIRSWCARCATACPTSTR